MVRKSWREKVIRVQAPEESKQVGGEDGEEKLASEPRYKTRITKLIMEDDFLPRNSKLCFESGFRSGPAKIRNEIG